MSAPSCHETICVQGAPGTGKTAVGLHRAAYLLYAYREQLSRRGVLVVGPNASFLRYIRDVLPALGEIDAKQTTIVELVADTLPGSPRSGIRGEEPRPSPAQGRCPDGGGAERALWSHVATPTEGLVVPRGARRWRVPTYEVDESSRAAAPRRAVRRRRGRCCPSALAHRILVKMELAGDSPDDRVQDAVARSKPVKDYVDAIWPAVDPERLLWRLLSDADFLADAADGILDPRSRSALLWPRPPQVAAARRSGRSPTRCCWTRPPTWSQRTPASHTSWRTRPRTCHR